MTEWQKSACILCECNCGLEIQIEGRRLAKIRGDKEHPASAGYTCEKPLRLDYYQNGRDRLSSPLRRTEDGTFEEVTWDTAIGDIAAKLSAIKAEHGGASIFFYSGGGQGNHLGIAYGEALRAAVGATYYSNALAQEKTGEMWVDGRLYGGHTKGDFEHSEVVLFLGKNPWQSHSFPRARPTLRAMSANPDRAMIVIDPRRSETADLADYFLQVKPGTDAWCLAAMLGVIVQEGLIDQSFIDEHTSGVEPVLAVLREVSVPEYAATCGVDEDLLRETARRFATAARATTYEDLGIQQAPNSTLVSYLNKLLWILTGNFGRPGTMYLHSSFAGRPAKPPRSNADKRDDTKVERDSVSRPRTTPVTGARIISGLIPCNSIPQEILTDHPDRFRAMWIDSSNPAYSLANSTSFRAALDALDLVVVVDVAMTETARYADYVLPASSQFEKWEATFFNFEFPNNVFQLRAPLMDPASGTLPEPEIYARVLRELKPVDADLLNRLSVAADIGREAFAAAFFDEVSADPALMRLASFILHETLGPTLPDGARSAAALWGAAIMCGLTNKAALERAGFTGPGLEPGLKLFDAVLAERQGVTFTVDRWEDVWHYVAREDHRFTVEIPILIEQLEGLATAPNSWTSEEYPMVLSAGERRSFTANAIIRDPGWRRRDAAGALRINPADAEELGLEAGGLARVVTQAGEGVTTVEITDSLQRGHISLPNGLGLDYPDDEGTLTRPGIAPNELTSLEHRDFFAGTPWHKHVPARVEPVRGAPDV